MGLHANTTNFENIVEKLQECLTNLEAAAEKIIKVSFPADGDYQGPFKSAKNQIDDELDYMKRIVDDDINGVNRKKEDLENAERSNEELISSIVAGGVAGIELAKEAMSSSSNNTGPLGTTPPGNIEQPITTQTPTNPGELEQEEVGLEDDEGVQTETPTDVEDVDKEEVDVGLEENVPNTQVEAVIELIYGEDVALSEDQKQRIVEAIAEINKTEILDGLEEDRANIIRSKIIQDYLDGELDLTGITAEDLQEYIDSHPDIKIEFELNEAIQSFESLIENGQLTEEQLETIIEEHIEICDSEEAFKEAYINSGGTQTDITEIESFYDPQEQKIHIRNTVDSTVITYSIITVLGDIVFYDEETGQVSYYTDTPQLKDTDVDIHISDNIIDSSNITDVEDFDGDASIPTSEDKTVDASTITKTEDIDTDTQIPLNDENNISE